MCGSQGEALIKQFLEGVGALVTDVSNEPEYWAQDIDLLVEKCGRCSTIEIKTDNRVSRTRNLFIESANPRSQGGGWYFFTKADLLYYLDSENLIVYVIKMEELRAFIERNRRNLRTAYVYDGAEGWLIPLDVAPIHSILYLQED